jgi:hypothetical protein
MNPFRLVRRPLHRRRHARCGRRKLRHRRRPIVAGAIRDRTVRPRRRRPPLRRRLRVTSANNSARRNRHKLHLLPRHPHANNGPSVRRNLLRYLHPLPRPLRRQHRRLRANNVNNGPSVRRNRHKLRQPRLLPPRQRRHQRRRLRRQSRPRLRQRLRQNRLTPIRAKSRPATAKTHSRCPDPVT